MSNPIQRWLLAYWVLLAVWVSDAALVMGKIPGGFFTSYAADVTLPAFLYIVVRGLHGPARRHWTTKIFGSTPELAACAIFGASALTELSQFYWPKGFFAGTFDPFDIAAYALGVGVSYSLDKSSSRQGAAPDTAR
ncbi:MAG: hypothetical protein ACRD6I_04465 [Candidatus Acidiferrales bacterium]